MGLIGAINQGAAVMVLLLNWANTGLTPTTPSIVGLCVCVLGMVVISIFRAPPSMSGAASLGSGPADARPDPAPMELTLHVAAPPAAAHPGSARAMDAANNVAGPHGADGDAASDLTVSLLSRPYSAEPEEER